MSSTPRKLTALDATLMTMGGIIGVGIFFNPQQSAAAVPHAGAFLSLWLFGGVIALCAAFTFAELGAAFPKTGGWFVFLREGFGRYPAFLFAWVVLFVVSTGATAVVTKFCASQLATALPGWIGEGGAPPDAVAAAIVLVITGIALSGVKRAALAQNVCMVLKLVALLALVVSGLVLVRDVPAAAPSEAVASAADTPLWRGWLAALLPTFFAYGGWQMVAYIAPEVERPAKVLPRALVLGVLGVVAVYLTANAAAVYALGIDGLAADPDFAATLAEGAFGEKGKRLLAGGIAISALGWCTVNIIASPWLYVAMAREGLFFRAFSRLHPVRGVPTTALFVQAGMMLLYMFASVDFLVDAVVFVEWVFHGLVAVALLKLRRVRTELDWPYRSPLYPLAPIVYALAASVVVVNTLLSADWGIRTTGVGVVAVGTLAFYLWRGTAGTSSATA